MTVINGDSLLLANPIRTMLPYKAYEHGVSYGLGEAGYDIRIKQAVQFTRNSSVYRHRMAAAVGLIADPLSYYRPGRFALASAIEEFHMPNNLMGIVHDKSTWARRGLSVFNTVIEPGWNGFLTLELVYHGDDDLVIPAGAGVAQVVFHHLIEASQYTGRYQDQADKPVPAIKA